MRGSTKNPIKIWILLIVIATFMVAMAQSGGSSQHTGEAIPVQISAGDSVSSGGGAVLAPTGAEFDSNTCVECHSDSSKVDDTSAADGWKDSVHADNDISCERCHSASVPTGRLAALDAFGGSYRDDHIDLILEEDVSYKAPSAFEIEGSTTDYSTVVRGGLAKQQAVAMCARCHGLTPLNPDEPKDVFQNYIKSAHGQSVVVKGLGDPEKVSDSTGLIDSAVCTDCHDPHETLAGDEQFGDDPESVSYKDNVLKLCTTDACHASDEVAEKYGISNSVKTYDETHHGKAKSLGVDDVPGCLDCHKVESAHDILPSSDPASTVNPDNVAEVCADEDCHGVDFNIGGASLHGKDADTTIGGLIRLFYVIVIPIVVVFFALYVVLDFVLLLGKGGE
jgi:hypothetical protein